MGKKNDTLKDVYLKRNLLTWELLEKWYNTATSIFIWKGVDDFISDEIERQLYENGSVVFFKDKNDGVIKVLKWAQDSGLNVYGYPVSWAVYGHNGFYEKYNEDNSVMIWNNKRRRPTRPYVRMMVDKLANIEATIDMNLNGIKNPYVYSGKEGQLLTFKNLHKKITENEPVIYAVDKMVTVDDFQVLDTGVTFYGAELMKLYNDYEGRILNFLGLKYVGAEKKERLVVDEVNANDEYTLTNLASMLKARRKACNDIKKIYGIDVTVEISPYLLIEENSDEDESDNADDKEKTKEKEK